MSKTCTCMMLSQKLINTYLKYHCDFWNSLCNFEERSLEVPLIWSLLSTDVLLSGNLSTTSASDRHTEIKMYTYLMSIYQADIKKCNNIYLGHWVCFWLGKLWCIYSITFNSTVNNIQIKICWVVIFFTVIAYNIQIKLWFSKFLFF